MLIDFDAVDEWGPVLGRVLAPFVSEEARAVVASGDPVYVQDATDLLFSRAPKEEIVDATISWVESNFVVGYHGSRLTLSEANAIRTNGLRLLDANERIERLERALSTHPNWESVRGRLAEELRAHGPRAVVGRREGQIHLTASRAGLTQSFNHYLRYGSEFDQRVASALLGEDGLACLARDGKPAIVTVTMPGSDALKACHPHFSIAAVRSSGDLPNLVGSMLHAWAYRIAFPDFQTTNLHLDTGFIFKETLPSGWPVTVDVDPPNLFSEQVQFNYRKSRLATSVQEIMEMTPSKYVEQVRGSGH